ncbi:MAG: ribosome biogenesis GTP-binding protein YihA/YsxC [Bdellovibrionaceae bacterium]|nr:ribosome biogenesis GTP-binding protein YihA/YsxC [Pseudobdellovibrionaceae bacterium]
MPSAKFIKSAVFPHEYPPDKGVEIAIAGRSNAGKSSLINLLTGSRIAKVSSTPGKTRLLNFFEMAGGKYTLVDMPGYGFATRSKGEVEDWQKMIEAYLTSRQSLKGLILVMDSRREWTEDEQMLKNFTDHRGLPFAVVYTKIDKLSKNELQKAVVKLKKTSLLETIFPVSALKRLGHIEFEEWLYQSWVKPFLGKQS